MYDRQFFQTKLGRAALASIAAMTAFIVISSQIPATPLPVAAASTAVIELA